MAEGNPERWRTVRAAIAGGWGTTARYLLIRTVPPLVGILGVWILRH